MREEKARGKSRRRYDSEAESQKQESLYRLNALLEAGEEPEFVEAITQRGLKRGSQSFDDALAAFRAERKRRQ